MGRGDKRSSKKMRRRKAQRKLKLRQRRIIEAAQAAKGKGGDAKAAEGKGSDS